MPVSAPGDIAQTRAQTILVLGDSISAAYGMSLEQGWVALLARQLAEDHPEYTVVNASISGETTAGGLRRLPQLLQNTSHELVIIELGGNDGLRGYPVGNLRGNLRSWWNCPGQRRRGHPVADGNPPQLRQPLYRRLQPELR